MALITSAIDGAGLKHFAALSAVRIMTGDAIHFHEPMLGAEQMGRALEHRFSDIGVAAETSILHSRGGQLHHGFLGVMGAVARHATHVVSVVLSATPIAMGAISGMALQT